MLFLHTAGHPIEQLLFMVFRFEPHQEKIGWPIAIYGQLANVNLQKNSIYEMGGPCSKGYMV